MGSRCSITLFAESEQQAAVVAQGAFEEIGRIERILTDFDADSESMRLTQAEIGKWHAVSPTLLKVLLQSERFFQLSEGAFDPTVGAYTHLWRDARKEGRVPNAKELKRAGVSSGFHSLEIDSQKRRARVLVAGVILDFGGIGKGYAADKALGLIVARGYRSAMVNLGGDIAIGDSPPSEEGWEIEIQDGTREHRTLTLSNCGIATSGDAEQFIIVDGIKYSHILDPRTGIGVTNQRAVSVIAEDAATADALASIVSVTGQSGIESLQTTFPDALFVHSLGNIELNE